MSQNDFQVGVIGGGLAGLTSAIYLAQKGIRVVLFEKNTYPFHKVCGEYISNEVFDYLKSLGFDPFQYGAKNISRLNVTGTSGVKLSGDLDLGAFGISRYRMDEALSKIAKSYGVQLLTNTEVRSVRFENACHVIESKAGESFKVDVALGSFGKRTKLDKQLGRAFLQKRSPYVGVKYHVKIQSDQNLISLHNFENGYCGMSAIEDDLFCLCYLSHRSNFDRFKSVEAVEQKVLSKNPFLNHIFSEAEIVYDKPKVINEITFESKTQVENHMLMIGDTAGMITPLCGNGMAMAIHGGKLASQEVVDFLKGKKTRKQMEQRYTQAWKSEFQRRLWAGRNIQKLFGRNMLTNTVLRIIDYSPFLLNQLVKQTHGKPIMV